MAQDSVSTVFPLALNEDYSGYIAAIRRKNWELAADSCVLLDTLILKRYAGVMSLLHDSYIPLTKTTWERDQISFIEDVKL